MRVTTDDEENEVPEDGPAIITGPGLYMTAGGHRVRITKMRPASQDVYPAKGVIYSSLQNTAMWRLSGRFSQARPHPNDVVSKGWK